MRSLLSLALLLFVSPVYGQTAFYDMDEAYGGYRVGASHMATVHKTGVLEAGSVTPIYQIAPTTPGFGPLGMFAGLSSRVAIGGSSAYTDGGNTYIKNTTSCKASWVHIPANAGTFMPHTKLYFKVANKGQAISAAPPERIARARGAVAGIIVRKFVKSNPVAGTTYNVAGAFNFNAALNANVTLTVRPTIACEMKGIFGDNYVYAEWLPAYVRANGAKGAWKITRRLRVPSTMVWEAATPIVTHVESTTLLQTSYVCATSLIGNEQLYTEVRVSSSVDPKLQNWDNSVFMDTVIGTAGTTGTQTQSDENFDGAMQVIPLIATTP